MSAEQQALPPELMTLLVTPPSPYRAVLSERQRQELELLPPLLQGRLDSFTEIQEDVVYDVSDPVVALEVAQTNVEDEARAQEALHFVQQMLAKARVGGIKAIKSHCDPKGDPTAATWLTAWAKQNPESRIRLTALLSDQLSGARNPSQAGQGVYTIRCIEQAGTQYRDVIVSVHGSGDSLRLYMAGSWSKGTYESLRSNLIDLARGRPVIEGPWGISVDGPSVTTNDEVGREKVSNRVESQEIGRHTQALAFIRSALHKALEGSVEDLRGLYGQEESSYQIEWFHNWAQGYPEQSILLTAITVNPPGSPHRKGKQDYWEYNLEVLVPNPDGSRRHGQRLYIVVHDYPGDGMRLFATGVYENDPSVSRIALRKTIMSHGPFHQIIEGPWESPGQK